MRQKTPAVLVFFFMTAIFALFAEPAQILFEGFKFGSSPETVRRTAKDVSNPQSWDETEFEIAGPLPALFKQFRPEKCLLTYYKSRLYSVRCEFPVRMFDALYTNLVAARKTPSNRDFKRGDRSATWYGDYRDGSFSDVLRIYENGSIAAVAYSDETQKNFRFGDLFRGMTPWLILAIAGLFCGYLLFGWLMTSKCPKCKTRKMKITGRSFKNPRDYNPELFGTPDIHWDEVYHFKCANCGFEKDDRYSGFMSWWRSQ